jgi:hypothetical protein
LALWRTTDLEITCDGIGPYSNQRRSSLVSDPKGFEVLTTD